MVPGRVTKPVSQVLTRSDHDANNRALHGAGSLAPTVRITCIGPKAMPRKTALQSPERLLHFVNQLDYDAAPQHTIDAPPAYEEIVKSTSNPPDPEAYSEDLNRLVEAAPSSPSSSSPSS